MKLREPAAKLWKKHREAVRRISRAPGGESRLLMGGGSVLAAEWGHRDARALCNPVTWSARWARGWPPTSSAAGPRACVRRVE